MTRFDVDLEELDSVTQDMQAFQTLLEGQLADLEQVVTDLHLRWSGQAAAAHSEAHRQWSEGAAEMRQALTELHRAATIAHGNYRGAATANTDMLAQTR